MARSSARSPAGVRTAEDHGLRLPPGLVGPRSPRTARMRRTRWVAGHEALGNPLCPRAQPTLRPPPRRGREVRCRTSSHARWRHRKYATWIAEPRVPPEGYGGVGLEHPCSFAMTGSSLFAGVARTHGPLIEREAPGVLARPRRGGGSRGSVAGHDGARGMRWFPLKRFSGSNLRFSPARRLRFARPNAASEDGASRSLEKLA